MARHLLTFKMCGGVQNRQFGFGQRASQREGSVEGKRAGDILVSGPASAIYLFIDLDSIISH